MLVLEVGLFLISEVPLQGNARTQWRTYSSAGKSRLDFIVDSRQTGVLARPKTGNSARRQARILHVRSRRVQRAATSQGYLTYKKTQPPRTLP